MIVSLKGYESYARRMRVRDGRRETMPEARRRVTGRLGALLTYMATRPDADATGHDEPLVAPRLLFDADGHIVATRLTSLTTGDDEHAASPDMGVATNSASGVSRAPHHLVGLEGVHGYVLAHRQVVGYHHLVLSPHSDERVSPDGWPAWTTRVLADLRERKGFRALRWVAVQHAGWTAAGLPKPHVHVALSGAGYHRYGQGLVRLTTDDARFLEGRGLAYCSAPTRERTVERARVVERTARRAITRLSERTHEQERER